MQRFAAVMVVGAVLAASAVALADEAPPAASGASPAAGISAPPAPEGGGQPPRAASPSSLDTPQPAPPPPAPPTTPEVSPQTSAPPTPRTAPEAPPRGAATPPPQSAVQSVAPEAAEAILGQRVTDPDAKEIGRLVDVLVDASGQPEAAVIDFGGFMGVGNRKIAVHWSSLRFSPGDPKRKVTLVMTPDQIKAAPEFLNTNKAAPVVTPASAAPTSP